MLSQEYISSHCRWSYHYHLPKFTRTTKVTIQNEGCISAAPYIYIYIYIYILIIHTHTQPKSKVGDKKSFYFLHFTGFSFLKLLSLVSQSLFSFCPPTDFSIIVLKQNRLRFWVRRDEDGLREYFGYCMGRGSKEQSIFFSSLFSYFCFRFIQ